jgi:hypothetical protein
MSAEHRAGRVFQRDVLSTLEAERRQRGERLLRLLEDWTDRGYEVWLRHPESGHKERVHVI